MPSFIVPTALPGESVAAYCARTVAAATAQIARESVFGIAAQADVDVSDYEGTVGPARDWVRSVIAAACEQIEYSDAGENLPTFDAGDIIDGDEVAAGDVLAELSDVLQDFDTYTDGWGEVADGAIPVYTHHRMTVYVDSLAYREDISDYGPAADGVEAAAFALYIQAERIAQATATECAAVIRAGIEG